MSVIYELDLAMLLADHLNLTTTLLLRPPRWA